MLKNESSMESRRQAQQQLYTMPLPFSLQLPPRMPNQIFCNAFAFAFVFSFGFGCETNIKYLFIRLLFVSLSLSFSLCLFLCCFCFVLVVGLTQEITARRELAGPELVSDSGNLPRQKQNKIEDVS